MKKENNDSSEESLQGDVSDGGGEKKSCCPRVTLEPVVLAYIFGFGFQSVVAQVHAKTSKNITLILRT